MVSYNIMKLSFRNFSGHAHQMIESFIILCSARCLHRWKSIIDLHSNQTCVDHSIFGRTRMYVESFDHEIRFACVEVLVLDLAFGITVQCIAVGSPELFYVEVRSTGTNLFIEVSTEGKPYVFFMSDGATRPMDARALTFLERMGAKVALIDSKDYGLADAVPASVITYFNPLLHLAVMREYGNQIAEARQHPLTMRRYMWKLSY